MNPLAGHYRKLELPGVALWTRVDVHNDGDGEYFEWMLFIEPTDKQHGWLAGGWHIYERGFDRDRLEAERQADAALATLRLQFLRNLLAGYEGLETALLRGAQLCECSAGNSEEVGWQREAAQDIEKAQILRRLAADLKPEVTK